MKQENEVKLLAYLEWFLQGKGNEYTVEIRHTSTVERFLRTYTYSQEYKTLNVVIDNETKRIIIG